MIWGVFIFKNRKSIRLKRYDYRSPGSYFITVNIKDRRHFFGIVINGVMCLSSNGSATYRYWENIPYHFKFVTLDTFIIMPDHMHGIINIYDINSKKPVGTCHGKETINTCTKPVWTCHDMSIQRCNKFSKPVSGSLSMVINHYKGSVTRYCRQNGYSSFKWQSRYWDRVIRNDEEYNRIKQYILNNPKKWNKQNS